MRLHLQSAHRQAQRSRVEKAAIAIEKRRAHRCVMREHLVAHNQLTRKTAAVPRVLVLRCEGDGLAVCIGCADADDVPRKITDHVAARNPIGQIQFNAVLSQRIRRSDAQFDLKDVAMHNGRDGVMKRCGHGGIQKM